MKILIILLILSAISTDLLAKNFSDINLLIDANIATPIREIVRQYVENNYVSVAIQFSNYKDALNMKTKDTDLMITADENTIDFLQSKGEIEKTISYIASDRLTLVSDISFKHQFSTDFKKSLRDLSKRTKIVITNPETNLSGHMASVLLSSLKIYNVAQVMDEKKALSLIKKGKGVGVLFKSNQGDLKNLATIPIDLYRSVRYQAVLFKKESSEHVTSFLKFILLNKSILRKHGMITNS